MEISHIIEPQSHGLWIAAGFIVALFALVLGLSANHKIDTILVGTQAEIMVLNSKIESMKGSPAPAQAAEPRPATPASVTK